MELLQEKKKRVYPMEWEERKRQWLDLGASVGTGGQAGFPAGEISRGGACEKGVPGH